MDSMEDIKIPKNKRNRPFRNSNDTLKDSIVGNTTNNAEYKKEVDALISTIANDDPIVIKPVAVKKIDIKISDSLVPVEICFLQGDVIFAQRMNVRQSVADFLSDTANIEALKLDENVSFTAFYNKKSLNLIVNINNLNYCRILDSIKQSD